MTAREVFPKQEDCRGKGSRAFGEGRRKDEWDGGREQEAD